MTTQGFTLRPPRKEDIPRLLELDRAEAEEVGLQPGKSDADDYLRWWARPHFDRERHALVAEIDGVVVASGFLRDDRNGQAWGGSWVLPEARGAGIGSAMMRWLIETAAAEGTIRTLFTGTNELRADARALIESFGFVYERTFFRMVHRDPATVDAPQWPDGVVVRALHADAAMDAIIEAHDASFVDHWNFTPADREEWEHWRTYPEWNDDLNAFAFHGELLVGFCCNWIEFGAIARGDLGPIGVVPSHRGRGIARALLRHSVRAMATAGATEVVLGVDSANPNGALRLYERNGFERESVSHAYVMKL